MSKETVVSFLLGVLFVVIGFVVAAVIVALVNGVNFFEAFDLILGSGSPLAKLIVNPIKPETETAQVLLTGLVA